MRLDDLKGLLMDGPLKFTENEATRFVQKVRVNEEKVCEGSPCWEWVAHRTKGGYGAFSFRGVQTGAHRLVGGLTTEGGRIGSVGVCACHRCDNPGCVSPNHLFIGTELDNIRDCIAKGRNVLPPPPPSGDKHYCAKLSNKDVFEIRRRLRCEEPYRSIAKEFGVHPSSICRIKTGRRWGAVHDDSA